MTEGGALQKISQELKEIIHIKCLQPKDPRTSGAQQPAGAPVVQWARSREPPWVLAPGVRPGSTGSTGS
jgi:hypothetical protein